MNMLYKIKDNYYLRIGRKYVKVDFVMKNNDISLVPNNEYIIEANAGIKAKEQPFDDTFKKKLLNSMRPRDDRMEEQNRSRYNR